MANTKLNDYQKQERKNMMQTAKNTGVQVVNLDNKTVMVYKDCGNTVEFALAVMAPDEQKFRVKVGEFYALERFFCANTVKMDRMDFDTMCIFVWDAYLLG